MKERLQEKWLNCCFQVKKKTKNRGINSSFKSSLELINNKLLFDDFKWLNGIILKVYLFFGTPECVNSNYYPICIM